MDTPLQLSAFASWGAKFALSGNGKESLNPILDPNGDPDHHQHVVISSITFPETAAKSACNFLRNPANKPTYK